MKRIPTGRFVALALCALFVVVGLSPVGANGKGSNWPQWRGPSSQGISDETGLPTEWSPTRNIQWKAAIPGRGHSSPIVWDKHIFLTTSIEGPVVPGAHAVKHMIGNEEFKHPDWAGSDHSYTMKVLSVDADSGKIIWERTAYEGTVFDHRHRRNTYASPTPITDGKHIYVSFGSEGLYCYDFKGNQIWKKSLGGIATLGMGSGTSPVLYENLVILQCDQDTGENSFLVALDKKTAKEVWRVNRAVQVSWTTPVIVKTAKRTEMISSGNEFIISYDPATGKEYWRCKGLASHAIHTPLIGNNMVYVTSGFPSKRTFAIRLGGSGDITDTNYIAWKYEKGTAYVASPILYRGFLYLITDKGILTCLDAETGEVKYDSGRVPVPASFMSSPVAFDGKILISSEDGDTFVVKAGPVHEIIRTNTLGEPIYSSPALSDGRIFIRGEKTLYCISNGGGNVKG
jgi:outer membrane protein assembly factor BamB